MRLLLVMAAVWTGCLADLSVDRTIHRLSIANQHMTYQVEANLFSPQTEGSDLRCDLIRKMTCKDGSSFSVEQSDHSTTHPWMQFMKQLLSPYSCAFALRPTNSTAPRQPSPSDCWAEVMQDGEPLQISTAPSSECAARNPVDAIHIARYLASRTTSIHSHLFYRFIQSKHFLLQPSELATGVPPRVRSRMRVSVGELGDSGSVSFLAAADDDDLEAKNEEVYEGVELLDAPTPSTNEVPSASSPAAAHNSNKVLGIEVEESSADELNGPAEEDEPEEVQADETRDSLPSPTQMKQKYKDLFPEYVFENPLHSDNKFLDLLPKQTDRHDFVLSQNAKSTHVAAGAKIFAGDVSKRAFTILLEEKSSIQTRGQSTFLLMDIVKLFAAPFVAVLYTPVGQPLSRGMGGGGKMPISGAGGSAMGAVMFLIIAFPLGLMLGILIANMLTEALTFSITWQAQAASNRRLPKQISDGIISKLNDYIFNAAAPTMRDIIKNLLIDVLSDTISNSLHHTLIKSVTERLSSTLTPATMHYYYCVYCYYYGDYCDICFKVSDYDILHKMWTIGQAGEQWTFDGP